MRKVVTFLIWILLPLEFVGWGILLDWDFSSPFLYGGVSTTYFLTLVILGFAKHHYNSDIKSDTQNDWEQKRRFDTPKLYFEWKVMPICLPPHTYTMEDIIDVVMESGIIKVYGRNLSIVDKITFRQNGTYRIRKEFYRVSFGALIEFSCTLPGDHKHSMFKYDPNIDGIVSTHMNIGSHKYTVGNDTIILSIDTRKESIEAWDKEVERKAQETREAIEKQILAEKIKERYRHRCIEKKVRQELIDKGEILSEAKRPPIPKDIADAVYRRDRGKCVYCGSTENLQFDHIIPWSKGGATSIENLQLLCQKCNLEKSNKIG